MPLTTKKTAEEFRAGAYYKSANEKEQKIISDIFGKESLPEIQNILGDVVDLYPYESFFRNSTDRVYKMIGASQRKEGYFYGQDIQIGSISLLPQFSLFPVNKKDVPVRLTSDELKKLHPEMVQWFISEFPKHSKDFKMSTYVDGEAYIYVPGTSIHVREKDFPEKNKIALAEAEAEAQAQRIRILKLKSAKPTPEKKSEEKPSQEIKLVKNTWTGDRPARIVFSSTKKPSTKEELELADKKEDAINVIEEYYNENEFTNSKVQKAMILSKIRDYGSGIKIGVSAKAEPYAEQFSVGVNGVVGGMDTEISDKGRETFLDEDAYKYSLGKSYVSMPKKQDLIDDFSILDLLSAYPPKAKIQRDASESYIYPTSIELFETGYKDLKGEKIKPISISDAIELYDSRKVGQAMKAKSTNRKDQLRDLNKEYAVSIRKIHKEKELAKSDKSKIDKPSNDNLNPELVAILDKMRKGNFVKIKSADLEKLDEEFFIMQQTGGWGSLTSHGVSEFAEQWKDEIFDKIAYVAPEYLTEQERKESQHRTSTQQSEKETAEQIRDEIYLQYKNEYGDYPTRFIKYQGVTVGGHDFEIYPFSETGSSDYFFVPEYDMRLKHYTSILRELQKFPLRIRKEKIQNLLKLHSGILGNR